MKLQKNCSSKGLIVTTCTQGKVQE